MKKYLLGLVALLSLAITFNTTGAHAQEESQHEDPVVITNSLEGLQVGGLLRDGSIPNTNWNVASQGQKNMQGSYNGGYYLYSNNVFLGKKNKVKKIAFGLATLLILTIGIIIFLIYPKEPEINFVRETVTGDLVGNTDIVPFKKREIEEVYFNKGKLRIVLDISGKEAGYTIEGSEEEVTIGLYRFRQKEKSGKIIPYDGLLTIDLTDYSNLKAINMTYY